MTEQTTVKLTYNQVYNSVEFLTNLLKCDMPMKTATRVVALANSINTTMEDFRKLQQGLMEKYQKRDESGEPLLDKDNNPQYEPEYFDKMNELANTETPYEYKPIHSAELGANGTVQPAILFVLSQNKLVVIDE